MPLLNRPAGLCRGAARLAGRDPSHPLACRARRPTILIGGLAVAVLLVGTAIRFGPAVAFTIELAATAPGTTAAPGKPAAEHVVIPTAHGPLLADLYGPAEARRTIVLVHGLSRFGRRHPELVRLAELLARRDHMVVVPELHGLQAFRWNGREVDEVRAAIRYGRARGAVTVAGFSFGAGPVLLAAAEEQGLRQVASFGGYADLREVIAYITTGVHTFGGRRYVGRQEEYNRWKLLSLLAGFLPEADERARVAALAEAKLADPARDAAELERGLGADARGMLALVINRREDAVPLLLAALPAAARAALDDLSPLRAMPRLTAPLLVAHGAADPSIPFTESLRLAAAASAGARVTIFESFHHTGPRTLWPAISDSVGDGWRLFRLVDALLTP